MQFYFSKIFLFFIIITTLSACFSADHAQEKAQYKQAKQSREIIPQIKALTTLASLEPQEYQKELLQAEKALLQLKQAQTFQQQKNWSQSYLSAHDSYRTFANKEAKELLISTGKHFIELVKIQQLMKKAYHLLPKNIFKQLNNYNHQAVIEWNIVEFNDLLQQLTRSSNALSRAVILMAQSDYHKETVSWFNFVNQQADTVAEYRNYLVSIAINASTKELLKQNKLLTKEAVDLLAYVRPKIAMNALQPKFNEAFLQYHPYQELMQNLYLSISSAGKKHAVDWYKEWQQTEKLVLMLEGDFSQYVNNSPHRRYVMTKIALENTTVLPKNQNSLVNVQTFIGASATMQIFLDKLTQDKAFLF